ncbi:MAG: cell division protein FtsH, partial [Pseudomonadota bacterium]
IAMGGRVAEEIIFGHDKVTSGASSDISYATRTARAMVTQYGLSDELGPLEYGENQEEVFLGHSVTQSQKISPETANQIDEVVRKFVEDANARATKILTENIDDLHAIANALLEYETLSGDEIRGIIKGEGVNRPDPDDTPPRAKPTVSAVPKAGKRRPDGPTPLGPEPQPEG